jgi:hypothetical protein
MVQMVSFRETEPLLAQVLESQFFWEITAGGRWHRACSCRRVRGLGRRGGFMWMLLGINAVLLVGLLFTLWRLHHLQTVLATQKPGAAAAVHRSVKPAEPRRREPLRQSALDEFPSETSLKAPIAPLRPPRTRPSPDGRSSQRLAPVGR